MRSCATIVLGILLAWLEVSATAQELPSPESCLNVLQAKQAQGHDAFVIQGDLDPIIRQGGGGACATAAVMDAIQTLRVMAGQEPLTNPHRAALKAIGRQEELLNGRVTDAQLKEALTEAALQYLPGWELRVDVHPSPHGPSAAMGNPWPAEAGPDLKTADGELKIATYTVTTEDGITLGRHFVLVKAIDGDTITVIDPGSPHKDHEYSLVRRDLPEHGRRVILVPPAKFRSTKTLELDSVFCLTLTRPSSSGQAPTTIQELQKQIDKAAESLLEAGTLRSPRAWRKATASFGLPGLDLPKALGGAEWSAAKTLEAFIHAGRHDLNCRDVVGGAHSRPLLRSADPKVLEIVRQVAAGRAYVAITMTEPTAGSDFHAIKSTAKKVDGGYVLTGEKRYVARLEQATHVIVFTQPASGKPHGLSAFVLNIDTPGLEQYSFEAHGLKGNSFGGMRFKDVPVAEWQMIGADGEGDKIFDEHFRYWRLMQVGAAIGTAERALEQMAERLVNRQAFGGPIGRFSHLQQALGQHTTELRMAKALAREATAMLDRGEGKDADAIINGLKAEGVEIALASVDSAMRAFGAEGYSDQVDLGNRLHDLQGLRIADGTTDVMRMSVVAKSFGKTGERLWRIGVKGEK
jgi:alkylation response protein AidB-like acyl-CoA dehydrogenase